MAGSTNHARTLDRLASLPWIVAWGLALRVIAAVVVQRVADHKGTLCIFDDTRIYWYLADQLRQGAPYVVDQWGVPHHALRTPGYPLFLAACQMVFGPKNVLAVRLTQAALGALGVWLLAKLVVEIQADHEPKRPGWTAAHVAAAWAATDPYVITTSSLLLSEALFVPLMLAALWGLAALWSGQAGSLAALGTGLASGAAVLAKPSWSAFVPALLLAWLAYAGRGKRGAAVRGSALVVLAFTATMAPWWVRNARIYDGRFVPTALWAGASLYDGLHPGANGGSDMQFLNDPIIRSLDEVTQDALLRARALSFVRNQPIQALHLAVVKAWRFWSPWPNVETLRNPVVALVSAALVLPFYAFMLIGLWDRRKDARALVLLLGPLLGTAALHMIFVGSIRYRIPVAVPAIGLAAFGILSITRRIQANVIP
ncbi:MAG: 4-amino-4-deoxy-L-arabinose transferase [Isosphaeraceae bacterium]